MPISPLSPDPDATADDLSATAAKPVTDPHPGGTPDPITGEPDAHPVGVGVGAFGGGAAGAALGGVVAGPVGLLVGAAIGAIAGGLAGKEVAETPESIAPVADADGTLDEFDRPAADDVADTEPLSKPLADRLTPHEDAFLHGGTLSGHDPDAPPTDTLDEFDRPHRPAPAAANYDLSRDDDHPLPTASSGLITPDETSVFADSTTGESSILAESPFPASRAVSPGDDFAATSTAPTYALHVDTEHAVRTNAYYRYLVREETGQPGSDFDDWITAEKEILGS